MFCLTYLELIRSEFFEVDIDRENIGLEVVAHLVPDLSLRVAADAFGIALGFRAGS